MKLTNRHVIPHYVWHARVIAINFRGLQNAVSEVIAQRGNTKS